MKHSVGNLLSKVVMIKWPHLIPALAFREFRINRGLYLFSAIAILAPWGYFVLFPPDNLTLSSHMYWHGIVQEYTALRVRYFDAMVSGLLGIAVFWHDRVRGHLTIMLEGPVRRRDLLWTKMVFTAATLFMTSGVITIGLMAMVLSHGFPHDVATIAAQSLSLTSINLATTWTTLATTTIVGSAILSVMAFGLWSISPIIIALMIGQRIIPVPQPNHWATIISRLSPFPPYISSSPPSWGYTAAFFIWSFIIAALGFWWWDLAPWETLDQPFPFAIQWQILYAILAFFSGLVLLDPIFLMHQIPISLQRTIWGMVGLGGFYIWRWIFHKSCHSPNTNTLDKSEARSLEIVKGLTGKE